MLRDRAGPPQLRGGVSGLPRVGVGEGVGGSRPGEGLERGKEAGPAGQGCVVEAGPPGSWGRGLTSYMNEARKVQGHCVQGLESHVRRLDCILGASGILVRVYVFELAYLAAWWRWRGQDRRQSD